MVLLSVNEATSRMWLNVAHESIITDNMTTIEQNRVHNSRVVRIEKKIHRFSAFCSSQFPLPTKSVTKKRH